MMVMVMLMVMLVVMAVQVLSRDSVTVTVDAVIYYRVSNPTMVGTILIQIFQSYHIIGKIFDQNMNILLKEYHGPLQVSNPTIIVIPAPIFD